MYSKMIKDLEDVMNSNKDYAAQTNRVLNEVHNTLQKINRENKNEYERGCEDVWEFFKEFCLVEDYYLSGVELSKIFGNCSTGTLLRRYSVKEALDKVSAYKQKKKEKEEAEKPVVGDIIDLTNKTTGTKYRGVLRAEDPHRYYIILHDCWVIHSLLKSEWDCKKTGKHFDIQGMLDEIKTED